jgi:mannose-6-phosphate isomerase-like protein (cupin superfamily)
MDNRLTAILSELRRRFEVLYGERLVRMILFGLQARGMHSLSPISTCWSSESCRSTSKQEAPVDHELSKQDLSRRAYVIYGPSAKVLSRPMLPRRKGQPTSLYREVGVKDDGHLRPMVAGNTTDSELPMHFLKGGAPTQAFLSFDCGPANRHQLEHLLALVSPIRWLLLLLTMMLSSQVLAGELGFTVSQLDQVRSFDRYDEFQLALLAQTPEVNIRLNRLQGRIKRHAHPQSNHFLYLIKGQIELAVGDETKVVGAGDFITIPQETPHAMQRIGDSEVLFLDVASPPDVGDVVWYE